MEKLFVMLAEHFWSSFCSLAHGLFLFVTLSLPSPAPLFPPLSQEKIRALAYRRKGLRPRRLVLRVTTLAFLLVFVLNFLQIYCDALLVLRLCKSEGLQRNILEQEKWILKQQRSRYPEFYSLIYVKLNSP